MPFNGSGVYNPPFLFVQDAANGIKILASRQDTQWADVAGALNICLTRDSQGKPTAPFDFNSFKGINLANGSSPQDAAAFGQIATALAAGEWIPETSAAPVFVSAGTFKFTGINLTAHYPVGRRLKCSITAGTTYCWVILAVFSAGDTTITVTGLSPFNLDAGLSSVSYGFVSNNKNSLPQTTGFSFIALGSDQAVTLNTATALNFTGGGQDFLGEFNSGAHTFTPLYNGLYLSNLKLASVALGPSGFAQWGGPGNLDAGSIIPVNFSNAGDNNSFFNSTATWVQNLTAGVAYTLGIRIGATTTFKATYTSVSMGRVA